MRKLPKLFSHDERDDERADERADRRLTSADIGDDDDDGQMTTCMTCGRRVHVGWGPVMCADCASKRK